MINVVMMFGVVSRVSHVILGLSVLAWSNSIGDLVADLGMFNMDFECSSKFSCCQTRLSTNGHFGNYPNPLNRVNH